MKTKYELGQAIVTDKRVGVITGMSVESQPKFDKDGALIGKNVVVTYTTGDGFQVLESEINGTVETTDLKGKNP